MLARPRHASPQEGCRASACAVRVARGVSKRPRWTSASPARMWAGNSSGASVAACCRACTASFALPALLQVAAQVEPRHGKTRVGRAGALPGLQRAVDVATGGQRGTQVVERGCIVGLQRQAFFQRGDSIGELSTPTVHDADQAQHFDLRRHFAVQARRVARRHHRSCPSRMARAAASRWARCALRKSVHALSGSVGYGLHGRSWWRFIHRWYVAPGSKIERLVTQ